MARPCDLTFFRQVCWAAEEQRSQQIFRVVRRDLEAVLRRLGQLRRKGEAVESGIGGHRWIMETQIRQNGFDWSLCNVNQM